MLPLLNSYLLAILPLFFLICEVSAEVQLLWAFAEKNTIRNKGIMQM